MNFFLFIILLAATCSGAVRPAPGHVQAADVPVSGKGVADSGKGMAIPVGARRAVPLQEERRRAPAKSTVRPDTVSRAIEVIAWPGKRFFLLEKPDLYCNYGYELYSCPQLDGCRGAIDTALFTKYHRARCSAFSGRSLIVQSVKKLGAERLVTFFDSASGRKLYTKTVAGVCHELAYEPDLAAAEKRWLGKPVFSARGFITQFTGGRSASIKVDVRDSLRVIGVRFGLTPLPAKPLWLMVETKRAEQGAIPLWYSWTNVRKQLRHAGNPWDDDVLEEDPAGRITADPAVWETINAHHVSIGMTRDQVRLSWGRPLAKHTSMYKGVPAECWTYEKQLLYFDEKELIAIEEK